MKRNGFFVLFLAVALILCFSSTTFAGGTVLYAASGEPLRLDPGDITEGHSAAITENIFECLLSKKRGTFEIQPGLAESWEVSQDGLEIIFHLRKGVKFHDSESGDNHRKRGRTSCKSDLEHITSEPETTFYV